MSLSVDIEHTQGSFALKAAFEAPHGITVLFGRSGSGKTTIVNAVAGLLRPNRGRIALDGQVVFDSAKGINAPPATRRIGYIFQDSRLFPHMSVQQNLKYGSRFARQKPSARETDRVVELLGINHLLARRPAGLSGGERQRVAIGRALLSGPRLLLADEPLANLDSQRKQEILPYFELLRDEVDVPILYVSHAPEEVARLANTVVSLQDGAVQKIGSASDMLSDPAVTPLGAQAAGALLEGVVRAHHDDGISAVSAGGIELLLPKVPHPVGTALRLRINAQDVMLATSRPEGISALNVVPSTITEIRHGDGPGVLVQLQAGDALFLARLTRRSAQTLSLQKGLSVYAVLKAVSFARVGLADAGRS